MKPTGNKLIVLLVGLAVLAAVGAVTGLGLTGVFDSEKGIAADGSGPVPTSQLAEAPPTPPDFIPPFLKPTGIQLQTRELAPGVYALLSGHPVVDNSGFVVGEQGVLVIDAHINRAMAQQIQEAVKQVTDKPILYLVNTNFHGDHTFGNYAFPVETRVVGHVETARRMADFEEEKRLLRPAFGDDPAALAQIRLRLPDLVFTDFLRLDLGGRVVELHHFGQGNTPGDTVVYVPEAQVAWTGNLVVGEGSIPPVFEGNTEAYLETIARFDQTLQLNTIVPGHGFMTTGKILDRYQDYLGELIPSVREAHQEGLTLEETVARLPLGDRYAPPPENPLGELFTALHGSNVRQTYLDFNRQ